MTKYEIPEMKIKVFSSEDIVTESLTAVNKANQYLTNEYSGSSLTAVVELK